MRRREFCAGALGSLLLSLRQPALLGESLPALDKGIRHVIDLSGEWQFQIDPLDVGLTEKGKIPWLVFAGVPRKANVWVNSQFVGTHGSYLTPLQIDLSSHAKAGETMSLVVRVDANRKRETDPLLGCMDTLDFLYITWGGIHRPVTIEATHSCRVDDVEGQSL